MIKPTFFNADGMIEPAYVIDAGLNLIYCCPKSKNKTIPFASESIPVLEQNIYQLAFTQSFEDRLSFIKQSKMANGSVFKFCSSISESYPQDTVRVYLSEFLPNDSSLNHKDLDELIMLYKNEGEVDQITKEYYRSSGVAITKYNNVLVVNSNKSTITIKTSGEVNYLEKSPFINLEYNIVKNLLLDKQLDIASILSHYFSNMILQS
jgi:hypothetical protein